MIGILAYKILKKIDLTRKRNIIILLVIYFFELIVFAYVFRVIPTWDFGMVYNSVLTDLDKSLLIRDNGYLYRYTNNTGIFLLLFGYLKIIVHFFESGYEQFSILLNIIFIWIGVLYIIKFIIKIFPKNLSNIFILFTLMFTPYICYTPIFYTDTMSMPFSIIALYYIYDSLFNNKVKIIKLIIAGFALGIGLNIKFSLIIIYIALIIYLILKIKDRGIKNTLKIITPISICIFIPVIVLSMYTKKTFDSEKLYNEKFPISHWIMMGMTDKGGYNPEDVNHTAKFIGVEEKKKENVKIIKKRLNKMYKENKIIDFYTKKAVFVWGDGTFFSVCKLNRMPYNNYKIQKYITDNNYNQIFLLYAHIQELIIMIFFIIGTIYRKYLKEKDKNLHLFLSIIIIGVYMFFLLWEARSRYLVNFTPLMLISCYLGITAIKNKVESKKIQ